MCQINFQIANAGLMIFLLYLPPILFALDKNFRKKFFKTHRTKTGALTDVFLGIVLFAIILYAVTLNFSNSALLLFSGLTIYLAGLLIAFLGYHTFFITPGLIQGGVYKLSRHPTYFFALIAILGIVIATSSKFLLFLLIIQFFLTHKIILQEEKFLAQKYKTKFKNYKKQVPRYV